LICGFVRSNFFFAIDKQNSLLRLRFQVLATGPGGIESTHQARSRASACANAFHD
jgi:hypothetical protein